MSKKDEQRLIILCPCSQPQAIVGNLHICHNKEKYLHITAAPLFFSYIVAKA